MIADAKTIDARLAFRADDELYRLEFAAMGTDCRALFAGADRDVATEFAKATVQFVADFETRYSRFRETSLISEINRLAGVRPAVIDAQTSDLLDLCDSLYFSSEGLIDVTTLPLSLLWDYRDKSDRLPQLEDIEAARALVGWEKVQRGPGHIYLPIRGMQLDFGGWGKEYAVDQTATIAQSFGIQNFLIDFGRDLRASGRPPFAQSWKIGIENPMRPDEAMLFLYLNDAAVASSGNYRRASLRQGRRYGHILDPRTGWPAPQGSLSATVVASTCLRAGELSTIACIRGKSNGHDYLESSFGAEGCLIYHDRISVTSRFHTYADLR